MKKVYLVIQNYSNEDSGILGNEDIRIFKKYNNAKEYFDRVKKQIVSFNTGYNLIESKEDYYCESEDGEYSLHHELVYIKELEVE